MVGEIFDDDPFGGIKQEKGIPGANPRLAAEAHARTDTDASPLSLHHTLGVKHNQAAPGDHNHDGLGSSRKIGAGMGLTCDTGVSTATDLANLLVMLHKVIEFTEV
jgi:hypothetical protein